MEKIYGKSRILICLIMMFSGITINYTLAQTDFIRTNNFGSGISQNCEWYDMDNDGDLDIAISNRGKSCVYRNDGNFIFAPILETDSLMTNFIKWIDINNDGLKDLFIGNNGDNPNYVYFNQGNGTFEQSIFIFPEEMTGIARSDIDKDGDYDLALVSWSHGMMYILKNDGQNNYSLWQLEYDGGLSIEFADVDNDNDEDIIAGTGGCIYYSFIYKNDGEGYFTKFSQFGIPGSCMHYLSLEDVDNDNDVDITSSTDDCDQGINIYLNDGFGNFTTVNIDTAYYSRTIFGDIDNDSDIDLIVGTYGPGTDQLSIYYNDNMNFTKQTVESNHNNDFPVPAMEGISLGDADNDNDLDIAVARFNWVSEFEVNPLANLLYINDLYQDTPTPLLIIDKIFPNPANDFVNISLTKPVELLKLINSSGLVVLEKKVRTMENRIDVSNLPSGVYNLQIISERNISNTKISVTR